VPREDPPVGRSRTTLQARTLDVMLIFLPPIVQILGGIAILGVGVAKHLAVLDGIGAVGILLGVARRARKRG
jgi:hypothetical protein